jgi:hypothetical protein
MGQNLTLVAQFGAPTFTSLRTIGIASVGNNLTVSGSITAQTLIVNTTSVYSGSTQFGSVIGNTHQFTGSILTSGSITVIGQYNGSGAGLTSIPNSATTATNANTANTIVTRDASGNFTAGTITATLSGNASTATTVTTNANLTGNVTSVGNATTIAAGVVTSAMIVDGTIVNGDINASAAIVDTKLATISTAGKVSNSATTATSANTVSAIVARDASGNFSAGTITATLTGNATNISAYTINQSVGSSNSPTFTGLTINGAITATGDITAFFSDMRLKTNIRIIDSALNKVMQLGGYYYNPNDLAIELGASQDRDERVGVIAQEVMEVLPHAIKDAPFDKTGTYKAVQYEKIVPLLIEAMKEQQSQIEELKSITNGITK